MPAIIASGGSKKTASDVDVIWIDAVSSFSYNFTATVTEHPIESGASISDHIYMRNKTFNIDGVIGGYPINDSSGNTIFADNLIDKGNSSTTIQKGINAPAPARVQYAYDLITKLFENKTPFTLIEELGRFDNCFITSLKIERAWDKSECLFLSMTVEQVRIVSSAKTRIFAVNSEYKDRAAASSSSGSSDKKDGKSVVDTLSNGSTVNVFKGVGEDFELLGKVMADSGKEEYKK